MTGEAPAASIFDEYATGYDHALSQGLSISGEDKMYFARMRVEWLRRCLAPLSHQPKSILDFGCGTGTSCPLLLDLLASELVLGIDASEGSIKSARETRGSSRIHFALVTHHVPDSSHDLAFTNGVFHHIPVARRTEAVDYIYRSLQPGGLFAFWENNPWNPGTRYVMSRIPFDRDAVTLPPTTARRLLTSRGFEILHTTFLFIFPRPLRWLRKLEPPLASWPFGAQYQVLCRRPMSSSAKPV
jgi:SAM-dependent methyltransferase